MGKRHQRRAQRSGDASVEPQSGARTFGSNTGRQETLATTVATNTATGVATGVGAGPMGVVQGAVSGAVQGAAQAATGNQLFLGPDGSYNFSGQGTRVGFRDAAGTVWAGVAGKQKGAELSAAQVGTFTAGAAQPLYRMEKLTLKDKGSGSFTGKFQGVQAGLLESGVKVLDRGGDWQPVAPASMAPTIRGLLGPGARIDLNDGQMWIWMQFKLSDEKSETARWTEPGHSKKEVESRQTLLSNEAQKLPAESEIRKKVDGYIRTISLVSSVEGDFDAASPPSDTYGSIGIFQWAMPKDTAGDSGSMGDFFRDLKTRATAASKKAEGDRSEEEKLYISAWKQCTDKGIDISGKKLTLHGKAATGGDVETTMRKEMAKGDLRTYQMVGAVDWIDEFRTTIIRPGPIGASLIGNDYDESGGGSTVTLQHKLGTVTLQAQSPATVGDAFTSEHGLAHAVMLGVNRPHYVETSLWKSSVTDPRKRTTDLLGRIFAGTKKKTNVDASSVQGMSADAQAAYAELQGIIWPRPNGQDQTALITQFQKEAMQLYSPSDARKYQRHERFSTVETLNWGTSGGASGGGG